MKKQTIDKLREYCIEEGVLGRKLPKKPNFQAAYEINWPPNSPHPQKLTLVFPQDHDLVLIQQATQVSPPHKKAFQPLSDERKYQFLNDLKKAFLLHNVQYGIDLQQFRWFVTEVLYDGPELTKNYFFHQLRRVFNASIHANLLIDEACRPNMKGSAFPNRGENGHDDKTPMGSTLYM